MSNTDNTEVPASQVPVVTNIGFAINEIAEANNQIRAKAVVIEDLEKKEATLKTAIETLELNKVNLEKENLQKMNEGKDIGVRKEELMQAASENMANETEALEKLRAEVALEKENLEKEKAEVEAGKAEAERVRLDNEKANADLESKILEAKRLSGNREGQLIDLQNERQAIETEAKRTEILKKETTEITEENRVILEKIEKARAEAEVTFEAIRKEREENERIKNIAQAEVGSADFIKNEAYRLLMIFRQALHTFLSVNGHTVRIPDLTESDLKFVAKDLINQIPNFDFFAEFPEHFADKIIPEIISTETTAPTWEKMTKPQLVEQAKKLYEIDLDMVLTQKQMVEELNKAKAEKESKNSDTNPVTE